MLPVSIFTIISSIHMLNLYYTIVSSLSIQISYPDLDAGACSGTEPVTVGAEAQRVNGITATIKCVQVLAFVQIPQHSRTVLKEIYIFKLGNWFIKGYISIFYIIYGLIIAGRFVS